eukprot:5495803-Amphidinium_carterae.2
MQQDPQRGQGYGIWSNTYSEQNKKSVRLAPNKHHQVFSGAQLLREVSSSLASPSARLFLKMPTVHVLHLLHVLQLHIMHYSK